MKRRIPRGTDWATSQMRETGSAPSNGLLQKGTHSGEGGSEANNASRKSIMARFRIQTVLDCRIECFWLRGLTSVYGRGCLICWRFDWPISESRRFSVFDQLCGASTVWEAPYEKHLLMRRGLGDRDLRSWTMSIWQIHLHERVF